MKTSIVVPNWQSKELLEVNLPKVLKIAADEVIVVDDGSTDGSLDVLGKFQITNPKLQIIENKKNLGFTASVNRGVAVAKGNVVVLLNTDVVPEKDLLKYTLPHFEDNKVFAVSFNEGKWSYAKGVFHRGLIEHRQGPKADRVHESFWASGGSAAFDKRKWEKLNGMDTIYSPFYWEDVDLSYRAQARGWKILWEPKAKVAHNHEGTIGRFFTAKQKQWVSERNQILFFWKNVSSPKMWFLHFLWIPVRLLKPGYWVSFLWAKLYLPKIILSRLKSRRRTVSDEEILAKFND